MRPDTVGRPIDSADFGRSLVHEHEIVDFPV